jgi:hypothetical protein
VAYAHDSGCGRSRGRVRVVDSLVSKRFSYSVGVRLWELYFRGIEVVREQKPAAPLRVNRIRGSDADGSLRVSYELSCSTDRATITG